MTLPRTKIDDFIEMLSSGEGGGSYMTACIVRSFLFPPTLFKSSLHLNGNTEIYNLHLVKNTFIAVQLVTILNSLHITY